MTKKKQNIEMDCLKRINGAMKNGYLQTALAVVLISTALLPSCSYAFGTSNRRPPPPIPQNDRQLGSNSRPGHPPPPPPHQSIRRQGLPYEGNPQSNGNSNNNGPPIGHRRMPNHHGPPPHHVKHRGRPPFPFPRRRPPPPPPRGRGPPPPRDRDQENRGRPFNKQNHQSNNNNNNNNAPTQESKLSFHIPPAPITTPAPNPHQDGFQQRPPMLNNQHNQQQQVAESQTGFNQYQQNNQQFQHQNNNQNQQQFHQQPFQDQSGQFPPNQNPQFNNAMQQHGGNQFQSQPTSFPNQQFQQSQPFPKQPSMIQQNPFHNGPSAVPPNFQPGPPSIPPTSFQPNPSGIPPTQQFQHQGFPSITNPPQAPSLPPMNPSQSPLFHNNHQQVPHNFQQQQQLPQQQQLHQHQHPQQQPLFGQINPSAPPHLQQPNHHLHNNNNNPSNPPILEYAPPPNTFQSTPQPDANLLQDKSKEIELNSIPKQTITFTVTPKPSKTGGTQLHFKISTPKPFKTTLKPITNSKGYFKGSTYRPPVDKLNTKFKYTNSNSNPGYPDTEYKMQDGARRESSMSAEMEPPAEHSPTSIKDLLLNREHSLNQPSSPHLDDTDNYAGPSYNSPPVYVKPMSGEEVLIAGISTGKTNYHKGHPDDIPFRGPSGGAQFDEDYDNGPVGQRNPYDEDDMGSKSYSDRHLHSYGPNKANHFDEYSGGKLNDEQYRRPSHSGSREEPYDDFEQERNNQQRPLLHIDEESLAGSGESGKRKFSQPDPLYHPEDDNVSGSKERERDHGGEFGGDLGTAAGDLGFAYGGSGERGHKDKEYQLKNSQSSKSTAEELLAALGLSTNPLVSMPNSKYPIDIPTKYSRPGSGSWEKEYDSEPKRNKNKSVESAGGNGEPMGLLEYLNQKKETETSKQPAHNTEPLYSVPDRPIAGSGENSFVVKGSMQTGNGGSDVLNEVNKAPSNNVVVGRPIPQYQGTEPDIITKQHNPLSQQSSYIEQKVKGPQQTFTSPTGQESYLYEKIHGSQPKTHHQLQHSVPVINTGLYGPSVPPPISEPGTFTDSPPVLLSSAAPVVPVAHQQPTVLHPAPPSPAGGESYLYQKIHGEKPSNLAAGLAFGPTPPSPHSVEDLSPNSGLYNGQFHHPHSGLYASASEQIAAATQQPSNQPGLVFSNGKLINPQQHQQQQQTQQTQTIGNGVLLPLGMGFNQNQPPSPNAIPVNALQQKLVNQSPQFQQQQMQLQSQTQQQILSASGQQSPQILISQQTAQSSVPQTVLTSQMSHQQQISSQQSQIPQQIQQQPQHPQQIQYMQSIAPSQQNGALYQIAGAGAQSPFPQQPLLAQHSQNIAQVVPAPQSTHQALPAQQGNLYGASVAGQDTIDRSAQAGHYSAEIGLQNPATGSYIQQQQGSHSQSHLAPQSPYTLQAAQYHQGQNPYGQQQQQHIDPTISASSSIQHQQQYPAISAVTPRYGHHGEAYPIYVTEPDPIIEIIVQDSNMTLPAMPTLPPPPPPTPPTPEPVHVFYVKYSQKNNTPVFDNYYGQSNPQIQLEQPISSVPVRGPDRNGMLPVDDTHDSLPQSSIQHQNIYNSLYATSTEPSTAATPGTTTTLRTIIRPDRNEFSHASSGLVVSFDNPAVEHEIFANYTNALMQQQQQEHLAVQQQHQQQQQDEHQQQQQQPHSYPEITFPPSNQQYQHYPSQDHYAHQQQQQPQQVYPSLDSLWSGIHSEQKTMEQQQMQQQAQPQLQEYQGFNKRIGLQELASLLETGPADVQNQDEQKSSDQNMNDPNANMHQQQQQYQQQSYDYHQQQQSGYGQHDEQNPPPLYQYVESPHHQSSINTRQAKLPEDVPEELRNQLVQSGILGNADIQVINYSENLFKELGELPPEALAAFQAHTTADNTGSNKQLDSTNTGSSPSSLEQTLWSGSQVSIANKDLSSLLPSGRSIRSVLVVKNSLRPKRGGRQRRVVLLITNKDDVLLYKPKDRSLKRIGNTSSSPLIKQAIELSHHRMDDEDSASIVSPNLNRHSA